MAWRAGCFLVGIIVVLFVAQEVQAQRVFRGTVVDAESAEALPAVTLQIVETGGGTISNAAGMFELRVLQLPVTLLVRHIGYETLEMTLDETTSARLELQLVPVAYELDEVLVTDEDPAYNIMRKVIARKQRDRRHIASYQAETYSRFMLYSDFELAQMQETIANHYWLPGEGTRSLIRARRSKPAAARRFRFASTQHVPDFYDDTIHVLGLDLIGPTHPNALEVYKFTLGGQRSLDGKKVYDIYFGPHSGFDTALIGHVSVLDEEYVLVEVHARPSPDNVLPAPIQEWDAYYEQQFAPVGDSVWMPVDLHVEGSVSFGRLGVTYPSAQYKQVSRLTRYVINVPPPDSLFQPGDLVRYAPHVDRQDYLFRWNPGLIPMTPAELESVVELDPRKGLNRWFRPIGLLSNYTAISIEEAPEDPKPDDVGFLNGIFSGIQLGNNRVEGLYLGLEREVNLSSQFLLEGRGGYGFSIDKPSYGGGLTYKWGKPNADVHYPSHGYLKVGYDKRFAPQYASRTYAMIANAITSYIGWEDYFDYYRRTARFAEVGLIADRLHLNVSAGISREEHESVESSINSKGRFFGGRPRMNPEISDGEYDLFNSAVEIGAVPDVQVRAEGNGLRLSMSRRIDWFNGFDRPFTLYELQGVATIPTFYQRRKWSNALHLRVYGSTYSGEPPLQYAHVLDVSRRPLAPFGAFKTLTGLPIKGSNSWMVFWEHDFSTSLFEYLGLWSVAQSGLGITLHGAHGQIVPGKGQQRADTISLFDKRVQHEAGLSLTHLFNLPIRFDVTRNFSDNHTALGIGVTKRIR